VRIPQSEKANLFVFSLCGIRPHFEVKANLVLKITFMNAVTEKYVFYQVNPVYPV